MNNYARIKAIEAANKKRWLKLAPELQEDSGIYILTRHDENGFRYAYVGQAKHVLSRLAQHLSGYQHIDLSLKSHKLYDKDTNPYGWRVSVRYCSESKLDENEKYYIARMAEDGWQLRNKTAGGQGEGKKSIADNKPARGYYDGKKQGYKDAQKFVAHLFKLYLKAEINGKKTARSESAMEKFNEFIKGGENDVTGTAENESEGR